MRRFFQYLARRRLQAAGAVGALALAPVLALSVHSAATATTPLPTALSGQSLVQEFDPSTLVSSAWNPTNQPGNCTTVNNDAKINSAGYAEIDTNGANNDCRSMQSPAAHLLPTAPGYTYEALLNFSSFHDWPAFWMYGPNWPVQGEIDAVEGGPGQSYVTWHQAGNHTIGPDAWDNQTVPYAGISHDIQPGVWTTVDISFTTTGVDIYYNGSLYVYIPESVTTGGNDPMYLTIDEGSCNADGTNVCNGGSSPAGSVQTQWVKEFKTGSGGGTPAPVPTPTPTTPGPVTVQGSHVVVTWPAISNALAYEIWITLPNGTLWRTNDITFKPEATYAVAPAAGTYSYQVRTIFKGSTGAWSAPLHFTVTS